MAEGKPVRPPAAAAARDGIADAGFLRQTTGRHGPAAELRAVSAHERGQDIAFPPQMAGASQAEITDATGNAARLRPEDPPPAVAPFVT